jgi:DNA invertase Pin-like site-specific DNA recombinase
MTSTILAKDYLRVSVDKSGRERSPEEQHRDNVKSGERHGFTVVDTYRDKVGSASKFKRKEREVWDRLVHDIRTGKFGAQVLVLWAGSRGSRLVKEWVDLLDACASAGVLIHITSGKGRTYNPSDDEDYFDLINIANTSQKQSADTSASVRRALGDNAEEGKPHGRIRYGYRREYNATRFVAEVADEREAPIVQEMFERVRAGHSLRAIERDLAERGIASRSGVRLSSQMLRSILTNEAYAGIRVHDKGRKTGSKHTLSADAKRYKAAWPALVSEELFWAVQSVLTAPERKTTRPGRGVHLLSMSGPVCGKCGGPLAAIHRRERPEYRCHYRSCVRINKADLDAYVQKWVLEYLSRPDLYQAITARDEQGTDELSQVRDELAAKRVRHQELNDQVADALADGGNITVEDLGNARARVVARITDLERLERELSTPPALTGLIEPGADVAERWTHAPMSTKREVVRLLLTPEYIGELRIVPAPIPGHRAAIEDRVAWRRQRDLDRFPWWEAA